MAFINFVTSLVSVLLVLSVFLGIPGYAIYKFLVKKDKITDKNLNQLSWPAGFSVALGVVLLAYNVFFHDILFADNYQPGIGIGLFTTAIAASLYFTLPKARRGNLSKVAAIVASLAGLAIAFRGNGFVHSLNFIVEIFAVAILIAEHVASNLVWKLGWILKAKLLSIPEWLNHAFTLIKGTLMWRRMKKNQALRFLKTAVLTLVVLIVFLNLLSDADPVFADLVKTFRDQLAERGFLSIAIAAGMAFVLSFKFKAPVEQKQTLTWLNFADAFWPALSLVILFGVFLFVQGKYLFLGAENFHHLDISYSDYVRKGFVELIVTVLLGGLLNYVIALKARDEKNKSAWVLTGLNLLLIVELAAMVYSAWYRNDLYIQTYGLTRIRVAGASLLVWISSLLAIIAIFNLWKKSRESQALSLIALSTLAVITVLNGMNMDKTIAQSKPGVDGRDHFYIAQLSSDASSGWTEAIKKGVDTYNASIQKETFSQAEINQLADVRIALNILTEQRSRLEKSFKNPFFWNFSRSKARTTLESPLFHESLDCAVSGIDKLVATKSKLFSVVDAENNRLYSYEYPFTSFTFGQRFSYYPKFSDQIYTEILEKNPALGDAFDKEVGAGNRWDFEGKFKENPELRDLFAPHLILTQCSY